MAGQYQEVGQVTQATCIEADKPVCVAQYMQAGNCSVGDGGPSMVLLHSDDATMTSVTFSTFSLPYMTVHDLTVFTDSANAGLITVDGVPIPAQAYTPFSACNDQVWVSVPLFDGSHTVQGSSGFTGIVHGISEYDASYAFSLGLPSQTILDSLICSDTSTVTLTAPSGFGLAIWSYEATPYDTLAVGSSYTYTPSGSASLIVRDTASSTICDGAGRYRFEFNDPITVSLTADANSYCAPAQISLTAVVVPDSMNVGYAWSPTIQRMTASCDTATAWITEPTLFQVDVVSPFGCFLAMDTVSVVAFPVQVPMITVVGGTLVSTPAVAYAWYLNSMGIPFASFQSFTPSMSGNYVVGTVDANGCLALSDPIYFAYNSIAEEEHVSFQAWSTGEGALRIEAPQVLDQVEILTVLGQPVAMLEPHCTMVTVPVNGSGVYLVRVRSGSLVGARKVALVH